MEESFNTPEVKYEAPVESKPVCPPENRPLSPWAYFGLQLLFSVPIVGFIFLIIFSCKNDNINRRNFARSYWCSLILAAIILAVVMTIVLIFGVGTAAVMSDQMVM